eukprot:10888-Heterococcus_DN1.PRE.2
MSQTNLVEFFAHPASGLPGHTGYQIPACHITLVPDNAALVAVPTTTAVVRAAAAATCLRSVKEIEAALAIACVRELAQAVVQAVDGLKYNKTDLAVPMLYIGFDRPCNTITVDASGIAAPVRSGHKKRHTTASLLKCAKSHNILLCVRMYTCDAISCAHRLYKNTKY